MTKTKERGYFSIETEEGVKWAHFSRTFLGQLKELADEDLVSLGKKLQKTDKTLDEQFDLFSLILHAGLNAYALENDIEEKYNPHKVSNWLWTAIQEDDKVFLNLTEALNSSLPKPVKGKGK